MVILHWLRDCDFKGCRTLTSRKSLYSIRDLRWFVLSRVVVYIETQDSRKTSPGMKLELQELLAHSRRAVGLKCTLTGFIIVNYFCVWKNIMQPLELHA